MYLSIHSLVTFFILIVSALAATIPLKSQWSTPSTCLRGLAEYDFKQCGGDLNDLIRLAHESIKGIQLVGMRLVDVIGPLAVRFCSMNILMDSGLANAFVP